MKKTRNIAVSGVDSQEKYDMVCDLVGDMRGGFNYSKMGLVVYDDGDGSNFMAFWDEQSFSHCTLYTYEDFIAKYGEKKCNGKWNGYYIEASQEAYDLLMDAGYFPVGKFTCLYKDYLFYCIDYYKIRGSDGKENREALYIVDGKLSATQYHPDEVAFKNSPEDFTITEVKENKYDRLISGKHNNSCVVDVYDVLKAFEVTNPALQHLIKKALCVGIRGHKDASEDLQDIIDSAIRAKELEK